MLKLTLFSFANQRGIYLTNSKTKRETCLILLIMRYTEDNYKISK